MALVLNVLPGRKVFIGRNLEVSVECLRKLGAQIKVSRCRRGGTTATVREMVYADRWEIGDGVVIYLVRPRDVAAARLLFEAPRWIVISRDDFTLESHLALQDDKEGA